jgi:hypothetical protein
MRRLLFFISCCLLFVNFCYAQDQLTGRVFENKSNVFLQGIRVENIKSHKVAITGPDGSFTINAAVGDVVSFTSYSYVPDTLYITSLKYVQVFLDLKQNLLNEVKVTNQQIKGNAGFNAAPEKGVLGSNTVLYQTDDNGDLKGGIKLNIPDGGETKKRHEERFSADQNEKDKIRKVFNADNLKKYLPISGQEMDNFIILYLPDKNTFYAADFNLIGYINGCYEEFVKIPLDQRQSKELTQLTSSKN